jgi:hypothetical protein
MLPLLRILFLVICLLYINQANMVVFDIVVEIAFQSVFYLKIFFYFFKIYF